MAFVMSLFTILLLTAVAVTVVLATSGSGLTGPGADAEEEARPRTSDPALQELRMRYARGEIDREEYLERLIDLE
ncbi:SHOCT domain-containing protein [Nocardiopsis sp. CNT312]|uniref:SHOCT domain-containing protein n=1 Tax=Nocardiopsis sp. CNT312 TaxID=1137268 RepID=UPI00048E2D97|nr:SHOCT domain-containing protein [Nocardiopsis sp. CNT312]